MQTPKTTLRTPLRMNPVRNITSLSSKPFFLRLEGETPQNYSKSGKAQQPSSKPKYLNYSLKLNQGIIEPQCLMFNLNQMTLSSQQRNMACQVEALVLVLVLANHNNPQRSQFQSYLLHLLLYFQYKQKVECQNIDDMYLEVPSIPFQDSHSHIDLAVLKLFLQTSLSHNLDKSNCHMCLKWSKDQFPSSPYRKVLDLIGKGHWHILSRVLKQ